jgi:hypothetical protein
MNCNPITGRLPSNKYWYRNFVPQIEPLNNRVQKLMTNASENISTVQKYTLKKSGFRGASMTPNDQAQRPPPETPGRLQQSLTNYLHRPTAQRGGGSLQRSG